MEMNSMTLDDRPVEQAVSEVLVNQAALDCIAEEDGEWNEGYDHEESSTAASNRSDDEEEPRDTYPTYI